MNKIQTLPQLDAFVEVPEHVGTSDGVRSRDGQWFLFRYGIVGDRISKWNESFHHTGLFVVQWDEFERMAALHTGKPFDSWVPQCVVQLQPPEEKSGVFSETAPKPR